MNHLKPPTNCNFQVSRYFYENSLQYSFGQVSAIMVNFKFCNCVMFNCLIPVVSLTLRYSENVVVQFPVPNDTER